MAIYVKYVLSVIGNNWKIFFSVSLGFFLLYYSGLLLLAMIRFGEIPNYVVFHDIIGVYHLILEGTPSLFDAFNIMLEEAWFETGYKNPEYYGVATWSYMLIPPKMFLVFLMGIMLATLTVLVVVARRNSCSIKSEKKIITAAGLGSSLVCLTSATLSWVVCCATPSWVVALAMLGMHTTLALWLEPLGKILMAVGLSLIFVLIVIQLRHSIKNQLDIKST